jgi:hypothetical protein
MKSKYLEETKVEGLTRSNEWIRMRRIYKERSKLIKETSRSFSKHIFNSSAVVTGISRLQ